METHINWILTEFVAKGAVVARETILIVEDEEDILELVNHNLTREGYRVLGSGSGEEGLKMASSHLPHLIVLDILLPDLDGREICRILKNDTKTRHIPILMLTAKGEESDIVTGLELGADDYMTKPFSPRVLIARIRSILRRKVKKSEDEEVVRIHELTINPGRHEILLDGKSIELTRTEFQILYYLARHPGWVFSRYDIINGVKGEDVIVTDRSVDVQIASLRKKLGPASRYVETVRGFGYRLRE